MVRVTVSVTKLVVQVQKLGCVKAEVPFFIAAPIRLFFAAFEYDAARKAGTDSDWADCFDDFIPATATG